MRPADDNDKGPIFGPRRFGWGWSLNFRRPASWLILILMIAAFFGLAYVLIYVFHLPRARPF